MRAVVLERLAHERVDVDALPAELNLVLGDARDVEQTIDHPDQVTDLPVDDLGRPHGRLVARGEVFEHVEVRSDRGQRIAQLMREHGDESALALVGLAQLIDQATLGGDVVAHRQDLADLPRPESSSGTTVHWRTDRRPSGSVTARS